MSSNVHVDRGVVNVPDNEGQVGSETKSLYPIGTADEQQVGLPDLGGDQNDSLASADDLIESLRSGSSWSQGIRVDQEDRERVINSAVFQDSLAIRAGLMVVVVIALVGLAWIVRSSISPGRLPSGPLVLTANSSPTIPDDKGDRIQPPGYAVRESSGDVSPEANPKRHSSTSNRAKPSPGAAGSAGSLVTGESSGFQRHTSSIRLNGKEVDSATKLTPVPETRPTTIEGWTVRDVTNGLAALDGPNGTWRVRRGDAVPGLGRIDSIVLWGQRWIVATSQGLISTP
jgi:hypothetical protein